MSEDFKELFINLLAQLEDKKISYSEISLKSGIKAHKFTDIKRGKSSIKFEDWEKLNAAYGEGKETVEDKIDKIDDKFDKMQENLLKALLEHEKKVANIEKNQQQLLEMFTKGGSLDQALEALAKKYDLPIEEIRKEFFRELEEQDPDIVK